MTPPQDCPIPSVETAPAPARISWKLWAVAGIILAAGLLFRVVGLDHVPGLHGDEAWFGAQAVDTLEGRTHLWKTPNGNPVTPFHFGFLLLLHWLHPEPATWLLRVPALAAGLLLVGLAFPLLRRRLGDRAAFLATLILAVLPVTIGCCRLGWDPSQSCLAVLVCVALALGGRPFWTAVAFLAALVVHPTNIFVAPVLAGIFSAQGAGYLARRTPEARRRILTWVAALGAAAVVVAAALLPQIGPAWLRVPWKEMGRRALDARGAFDFIVLYGRLLSGATAYQSTSGPLSPLALLLHDVLFWAIALPLAAVGGRRLIREKRWVEVGLAGGLLAALVVFYLVAGLYGLETETHRYGLFAVVPSVLVAAACLRRLEGFGRIGHRVAPAVLVLAGVLLLSFYTHYFLAFERTGGLGHGAYRTGPVDPKAGAWEIIRTAKSGDRATLIAESWWVYWPLRYLSSREKTVRLCQWVDAPKLTYARGERLFVVGFADSYGIARKRFDDPSMARAVITRWAVPDYGKREAILIWEVVPPRAAVGAGP